jgi:hypothetical protein
MHNPTTAAQRRYYVEFTLAILAYTVVLIGTRVAFRDVRGPAEFAAAIAPAIPLIFVFVACVRWLRGTDEFNRKIIVESLAIAGGVTAMLAATYGFLEIDLLPRPSAWCTWIAFMSIWLIASLVLRLRYR